jgi:transcription elongation factor Elf1
MQGLSQEYQKLFKIKNRKKNRRLAAEIDKKFECPYERCYRDYGSDVSLNLHIKLKHGGGNKTDRDKLAVRIC